MNNMIRVGRTTVETHQQAIDLSGKLVDARLVACAQVDGPLTSVYRWNGKIEQSEEWGLTLKFPVEKEDELSQFLAANHPYEEPQWVHWESEASAGYAEWVTRETSRSTA